MARDLEGSTRLWFLPVNRAMTWPNAEPSRLCAVVFIECLRLDPS
jgi:hypothetical protein